MPLRFRRREPLPYLEEERREWNELASRAFTATFEPAHDPAEIVLTGRCPRCRHITEHVEPLVVVLGFRTMSRDEQRQASRRALDALRATGRSAKQLKERDVAIICACGEQHAGRGGRRGCGASWTVRARWEADR